MPDGGDDAPPLWLWKPWQLAPVIMPAKAISFVDPAKLDRVTSLRIGPLMVFGDRVVAVRWRERGAIGLEIEYRFGSRPGGVSRAERYFQGLFGDMP
jgi:hypothetical protein